MVLASTVLVAAVPNFAKLAYDSGASVLLVVLGRFLVGTLLLGSALFALRRDFATSNRVIRLCVLGGFSAGIMTFCLLSSIVALDISLAILIFYLHPVIIAWLGHVRGTYELTPSRLLYCLLVLIGLALALSVSFARLAPGGIGLALGAAFAAAFLVIANGDAVSEAGSILVNFHTSLTALIVIGFASLTTSALIVPGAAMGWLAIVGAGAAFSLGLVLFVAAIPAIGMVRASLIGVVEPLITILIAMAMFGERLAGLQWVGVAIVLSGLALLELPPKYLSQLVGRGPPQT